jgi:hypothetical protein
MDKIISSDPLKQPFWRDGPEIQYKPPPSPGVLTWSILIFIAVYRILFAVMIFGLGFFILYKVAPVLVWAWFFLIVFTLGLGFYLRKRRKQSSLGVAEIQQKARERSGASVIGSAIHVAGHPLLEREQPVVLALTSDGLKIFRYDDPYPIDILSLDRLAAIHTVVYDEDRIPHIDTVDGTAQALQVTFKSRDQEFTCLFRRMLKVRPIDWYHEIQKGHWQPIRE